MKEGQSHAGFLKLQGKYRRIIPSCTAASIFKCNILLMNKDACSRIPLLTFPDYCRQKLAPCESIKACCWIWNPWTEKEITVIKDNAEKVLKSTVTGAGSSVFPLRSEHLDAAATIMVICLDSFLAFQLLSGGFRAAKFKRLCCMLHTSTRFRVDSCHSQYLKGFSLKCWVPPWSDLIR